MWHRSAALCLALLLWGAAIAADSNRQVGFSGRMGEKAVLVINGQVHILGVGQSRDGIKLLSLTADEAVVDSEGRQHRLGLGNSPARLAGSSTPSPGRKIILSAGNGGHFVTSGMVNGRTSMQFLVDTGATSVTISQQEASRLGLDLKQAQRLLANTANGQVVAFKVTLDSIRIQDVMVYNVEAMVVPAAMPFGLLGNSFLTRFQMKRENDQLTLEKRL